MDNDEFGGGPVRFSTEDVPERDRLAVWRELLGRVHLHLDIAPLGEEPLRATFDSHRWASTSLYFSDTTPVRATRTRELVQDADGAFRLLYTEGGSYRFTTRRSDDMILAGSAALLFNGVTSEVSYPRRCHVTAVRVDRAALSTALPALDERPIRRLPPASPAARLLTQYIGILRAEGPTTDASLALRTSQHLTDLIVLALGATGDFAEMAQDRSVRVVRLAAIKADILTKLGQPDLSIATIAARHGVTPRHVQKLFERSGTTFSAFTLQHRLARAQQMLIAPRFTSLTIGEIALECGFGDLSYFNRTFRRTYQATPSDIRHAALRMR
ncbi:MAG: helix-turn-helix transcriptional regulator [Pseudomonadota bacterium]|jgi:AraC-like DNA-binding protein